MHRQVRITSQGKSRSYISYGTNLLTDKGHTSVVLRAMGKAINKTVTIGACCRLLQGAACCRVPPAAAAALDRERPSKPLLLPPPPPTRPRAPPPPAAAAEIMKRRIAGLHQHTRISSVRLTDRWEPREEGLDPIETTRHVSVIFITLSKARAQGWGGQGRWAGTRWAGALA